MTDWHAQAVRWMSLHQQLLMENNEYERLLNRLLKLRQDGHSPFSFLSWFDKELKEFRRRMKPVRALRKARPKFNSQYDVPAKQKKEKP